MVLNPSQLASEGCVLGSFTPLLTIQTNPPNTNSPAFRPDEHVCLSTCHIVERLVLTIPYDVVRQNR